MRDLSETPSNYRSTQHLEDYCLENDVIGICEIDTRSLTRRVREEGSLVGVVSTEEDASDESLLEASKNWSIVGKDLLSVVSCSAPYEWEDATSEEWKFGSEGSSNGEVPLHVCHDHEECRVTLYSWQICPSFHL